MRRVAVTGVGAVSPCGLDAETAFRFVAEGQSGIKATTLFDAADFASRIAGECRGFEPELPHEARRRKLSHVLSNSFGFGGTNASILFAAA